MLDDRQKLSPKDLNEVLMRMLAGSRVWDDGPQALQILSCIDRIDKRCQASARVTRIPTWRGVFGMYSKTDQAKFTAHFARALRQSDSPKGAIVNALLGALGLSELACNRISDAMPAFLAELESISPEDQAAPD